MTLHSNVRAMTGAWQALEAHAVEMRDLHLRDLMGADPERFRRYAPRLDGFLVDFSKQRWNTETLNLLQMLARERRLEQMRDKLFAGEQVNETEHRAALHMALRAPGGGAYRTAEGPVGPFVTRMLAKLAEFSTAVRSGAKKGAAGKPFRHVVSIGIGGSDLGPRMAAAALRPYTGGAPAVHYVSNVDAEDLAETLRPLAPDETLFVVASKTFGTQETITNALSAKEWLAAALGETAVADHFCALSSNREAVEAFGVNPDNMFMFWDWVGGRFSIWSAIGLSLMIAIGPERFDEMLAGAHEIDEHFRTTPLTFNIPVLLGLAGIWNGNFLGARVHAVLPYDHRLRLFPDYLQQLEMESNGKSVTQGGRPVDTATSQIIMGQAGTNGQHAFYQLLHQGTDPVSADFMVAAASDADLNSGRKDEHHAKLLANCLAQSEALMRGRTWAEAVAHMQEQGVGDTEAARLAPQKTFLGNKPSTTFLFDKLTPRNLGRLIAIYEHKVFVQAVIWGVNPFDQWGVELGKEMAAKLLKRVIDQSREPDYEPNPSTEGLLGQIAAYRKKGD